MKNDVFYENIHKASNQNPYINLDMKNINYLSHFHEEVEVVYMVYGSSCVTINNIEYTFNQGDIAIIMPGEIHSFSSSQENKLYIIKINQPDINTMIDFSLIRLKEGIVHKHSPVYKDIKDSVENIAIEICNGYKGYQVAVNIITQRIFLTILRDMEYESITINEKKKIKNRLDFLNSVDEFIQKNYQSNITLNDVARHCNLSLYYFSHYFKEATGKSFLEHLCAFRIERATSKISISNETLTDIAFNSGFNSIRSFNRIFKKYMNTTPSEYRKKFKI